LQSRLNLKNKVRHDSSDRKSQTSGPMPKSATNEPLTAPSRVRGSGGMGKKHRNGGARVLAPDVESYDGQARSASSGGWPSVGLEGDRVAGQLAQGVQGRALLGVL